MPRGHLLSFYTRFLGKKRTSLYISWEKGDYYYIQTWLNNLFYHYNLFLGKLKEKFRRKVCVITERVYQIMLFPPGHPIILLKSNKFNMATISVKRSIVMLCAIVCIVVGQWNLKSFLLLFPSGPYTGLSQSLWVYAVSSLE